jgi:putative NADH-flavin reductase
VICDADTWTNAVRAREDDPMRIVVFGASGGTGRELVKQGMAQGHELTVFVRNPSAFTGGDRMHVGKL